MNDTEYLQSLKNELTRKVLSICERCTNIEQREYLIQNEITKYTDKLIVVIKGVI